MNFETAPTVVSAFGHLLRIQSESTRSDSFKGNQSINRTISTGRAIHPTTMTIESVNHQTVQQEGAGRPSYRVDDVANEQLAIIVSDDGDLEEAVDHDDHAADLMPLRSIEELSDAPFPKIRKASATSSDVNIPAVIASIFHSRGDAIKVEEMMGELSSELLSDGPLKTCAATAVPFVASIAACHDAPQSRLEILRFLITMALTAQEENELEVKANISRATALLLRIMRFNTMEPSLQNVHLCFLMIAAPPTKRKDITWVLSMLANHRPASGHSAFTQLIRHAKRAIRIQRGLNNVSELEELETEVLERAEDWEAQAMDRARLVALCGSGRSSAHRAVGGLPVDVLKMVKQFLFSSVAV